MIQFFSNNDQTFAISVMACQSIVQNKVVKQDVILSKIGTVWSGHKTVKSALQMMCWKLVTGAQRILTYMYTM